MPRPTWLLTQRYNHAIITLISTILRITVTHVSNGPKCCHVLFSAESFEVANGKHRYVCANEVTSHFFYFRLTLFCCGYGSRRPRVLDCSSNIFLLLKYSLLSIFVCKFPFSVAVFCSQLMNCWNLGKLGASRFYLQLASLEIDHDIQGGTKK